MKAADQEDSRIAVEAAEGTGNVECTSGSQFSVLSEKNNGLIYILIVKQKVSSTPTL